MRPDNLTRRGFLGGLFAVLTAGLCPRPPRAIAAPIQPAPTAALQPRGNDCWTSYSYDCVSGRCTTYTYDGMGRLVSMTDHPPAAIEQSFGSSLPHGQETTYIYSFTDYVPQSRAAPQPQGSVTRETRNG